MNATLRLRMRSAQVGSLDGLTTRTYQAGEVYDLPNDGPRGLAAVFLREGWAEPVRPEPEPLAVHPAAVVATTEALRAAPTPIAPPQGPKRPRRPR